MQNLNSTYINQQPPPLPDRAKIQPLYRHFPDADSRAFLHTDLPGTRYHFRIVSAGKRERFVRNDPGSCRESNQLVAPGVAHTPRRPVAGFSGNVVYDAFGQHDGYVFATADRDVDGAHAQSNGGGFWYSGGGGYARVNAADHLFDWSQLPGGDDLMYSQMWLECP